MSLSIAQLPVLRASIDAITDQVLLGYLASGNLPALAESYSENSTFVVWKQYVSEHEIVGEVSPESTTWDWTAYIATSVAEKMAWERIFNGTFSINPSLLQIRDGIAAIFSGPSGAGQRTHLLAMSKRFANKAEALFATGTGTTAVPGTLVYVGSVSTQNVIQALALP